MSLSSGDYSWIGDLAREMTRRFENRRVKVSLPSLRIDSVLKDALSETQKVRKTALTLAPEAGTQRLRDVINKGVTEDDLMRSVRDAFEAGWSAVKLYFMLGLPTETDEDVDGIADLARKVQPGATSPCPRKSARRGFASRSARRCSCPSPSRRFSGARSWTRIPSSSVSSG